MKYLNAAQAAKRIGISDKTIRRWLKEGKISAIRTDSNQLMIPESEVESHRRQRAQFVQSEEGQDTPSHDQTDISALAAKVAELEQEIATLKKGQPATHEQEPVPSVSTQAIDAMPQTEVHQSRVTIAKKEVSGKRAYKPRDTGLPGGCITALDFARAHNVKRETFRDHMLLGLGPGTVPGEQGDPMLPVKEQVDYSERDHPSRKGETERYLTPEQQKKALDFWKRHGVAFTMPDTEQEAKQEAAWYLPD